MKTLNFIFVLGLSMSGLLGCASVDTTPEMETMAASPTRKESQEITVHQTPYAADKKIPGRSFYIEAITAAELLPQESVRRLREVVVNNLKNLGYQEVSSYRKAHVVAAIGTMRTETTAEEDEAEPKAQFGVSLYLSSYGKRPIYMSSITMTSPTSQWSGREGELVLLLDKEFSNLIIPAPRADEKMKGDPGCLPRFGFDYKGAQITEVFNGSPAQTAGMKVGDELIAIDSKPYDSDTFTEIYEKRIKVPVKFKRNNEIIRAEMQAKLMCDHRQ